MEHDYFLRALLASVVVAGSSEATGAQGAIANEDEPVIRTTGAGVDFVRTPDTRFESLPGWSYEPQYVEIDGLRQAYVDEGPRDGPIVLLLHGQPSWSYLYRKMIPVLVDAGYRVIAMDHLGMGRSDKPIAMTSYSYLGHCDRLGRFIEELDLREINLFVQDWGSLIGLRVAGLDPDRFARIAVGNGILPVIPEGLQPFPKVEDPDEVADIPSRFALIPAQQFPFYDGCKLLLPRTTDFGAWMTYAMRAESFRPSEVVEAMTWYDLSDEVEAAYDAPFPSRTYMAGVRVFPSLVNELPGVTEEAWAGLTAFERPVLTLWAANDPGMQGSCEAQEHLVASVPGARGQPHDRLAEASHFLQEDQGGEIARRLVAFYASDPIDLGKSFGRGDRYGEILLVRRKGLSVEAEVWGTQGLNDCPAASWEALDAEAIRAETRAFAVRMNGPRYWLPDATAGAPRSAKRRTFGDLDMRLLATVEINPRQGNEPYTERTVQRRTTFVFKRGEEIYELTSPNGVVYVMQSMSQIVDPSLTLAELPTLDSRLVLPDGWTYRARTLDADLVLIADGEAIVLQDDLSNTYLRR